MKFLNRLQPLGLAALRIVLGVIMFAHGWSKIFGSRDHVSAIQHHVQFISSLGLPGWTAYLSAAAEFGGGALLIIGLLTRFAAFAVLINMLVAIFKVHLYHGLTREGGFEFPLSLAAIAFSLMFFGAGPISIERMFGKKGS